MNDTIEFENYLRDNFFNFDITPPDYFDYSNKIIRFDPTTGSTRASGKKMTAWYTIKSHLDGFHSCFFGDFKQFEEVIKIHEKAMQKNLFAERPKIDPQAVIEKNRKIQAQIAKEKRRARNLINYYSENSIKAVSHPYLRSKGFKITEEMKLANKRIQMKNGKYKLLIPLFDVKDSSLMNYQSISDKVTIFHSSENYSKKDFFIKRYCKDDFDFEVFPKHTFVKMFVKGAEKKGGYFILGLPDKSQKIEDLINSKSLIGLAEGYATALEVHLSVGIPVVVCFDAGNLLSVTKELTKKINPEKLLNFADNDLGTKIKMARKKFAGEWNKGEQVSNKLKAFYGIESIKIPLTEKQALSGISDFNDYSQRYGRQAVTELIYNQIVELSDKRSSAITDIEKTLEIDNDDDLDDVELAHDYFRNNMMSH